MSVDPEQPDDEQPDPEQPRDGAPDPFAGPAWDAATTDVAPGTEPPVRRRRRTSLRRLRRRRFLGLGLLLLGALIVVTGLWILVTGLLAKGELSTVRSEVHQLRREVAAGDLAAARATAAQISAHAQRAHELTTGPAWAVVASIPAGGEPLQSVRTMTTQADALSGRVLPGLVRASERLDPDELRRPGGALDLPRIAAAAPVLDRAVERLAGATQAVAAAPADTWLGAVDSARRDLLDQLTGLQHTLRSGDLAAHIVPAMLGAQGVRHYFVAFQNEAEARGTGGVPGAFAILTARAGQVSFERFESDTVLHREATGLDFGADYDQLFAGALTTTKYANSNLSPNFPYAAQIWMAMWQRYSGERLDGAMALDPTALSYLLKATGGARLPDGTRVNARNVVALTESTVYAKFPKRSDQDARKRYLLALARVVSRRVFTSAAHPTKLVRAAGEAAGQRRLLVYSADPAVESELLQTSMSGAVPRTSAPYVGLSIVNDGGNKLDYYLDRSLTWQRTGCGAIRNVTVTVRLTNRAPGHGLSPYVTARQDRPTVAVRPGDNRLEVSYYGTAGALMQRVEVDGKPASASIGRDLGHPVYTVDLELPHGRTRTIVWHFAEPAGSAAPIVLRQPLVRPLHVRLLDAHC